MSPACWRHKAPESTKNIMEVRIASRMRLKKISPVMRELRPAFDEQGLIAQIKEQRQYGYQVALRGIVG